MSEVRRWVTAVPHTEADAVAILEQHPTVVVVLASDYDASQERVRELKGREQAYLERALDAEREYAKAMEECNRIARSRDKTMGYLHEAQRDTAALREEIARRDAAAKGEFGEALQRLIDMVRYDCHAMRGGRSVLEGEPAHAQRLLVAARTEVASIHAAVVAERDALRVQVDKMASHPMVAARAGVGDGAVGDAVIAVCGALEECKDTGQRSADERDALAKRVEVLTAMVE